MTLNHGDVEEVTEGHITNQLKNQKPLRHQKQRSLKQQLQTKVKNFKTSLFLARKHIYDNLVNNPNIDSYRTRKFTKIFL